MKKVDRYVFKELAVPMIVGTVIIALLFMANEFIAVFKNFEITHLPFVAMLQHWRDASDRDSGRTCARCGR